MITTRRAALCLLMLTVSPAAGRAQDPAAQLQAAIRTTAARISGGGAPLSPMADSQLFVLALAAPEDQLLAHAEENRTDKQLGADGSTSGGTSLVSKGGVPAVLAFAVENGALEQSQSGTTITFRGTPAGIVRALLGKGYLETYTREDPAVAILQRFSFGMSFDTNRGALDDDVPVLRGTRDQLSAVTARVTILDQRDPRSARYDSRWNALAATAGTDLAGASVRFVGAALADPAFTRWLAGAQAAVAAAPAAQKEIVIREQLRGLRTAALTATTLQDAAVLRGRYDELLAQRRQILAEVERGTQVVVDYTNDRPAEGNDTSRIRLVAAAGHRIALTGNLSTTLYNGPLPFGVTRRLRDVQAAVQVDVPVGRAETVGRYVLTFAYKLKRLTDDIPGPAGVVLPDSSGTLSVGQVKLTVPIRDTGVRIPLSVTVANRSELVRERVVRGNVGVSYDFDAVFARFKP